MIQSKLLSRYTFTRHYFCGSFDQQSYFTRQIHSGRVIIVPDEYAREIEADGMISKEKVQLAVKTADCLPIFLVDTVNTLIGCIHAGWRGLSYGIINATINRMLELSRKPQNIIAAIGPHIGVCCYDVSKNRVEKFMNLGDTIAQKRKGKWYLNLGNIAYLQLKAMGIRRENIDLLTQCTYHDQGFRSFRRDGKHVQRMVNVIGLK